MLTTNHNFVISISLMVFFYLGDLIGDFDPQVPADLLQFVGSNPNTEHRHKFMCTICFHLFMQSYAARDHVENAHFPNKFDYRCDLCDKLLKSKIALKYHKH